MECRPSPLAFNEQGPSGDEMNDQVKEQLMLDKPLFFLSVWKPILFVISAKGKE